MAPLAQSLHRKVKLKQAEQDAIDARRWRALKKRYARALCRLATDSHNYSSAKSSAILDAWADRAAAEVEAFDPAHWLGVEVPERIAELERELGLDKDAGTQTQHG